MTAVPSIARPRPGSSDEVDNGGSQDEKVAGDGSDDADQGLHSYRSCCWRVVRGGRSVLTPSVCGRRERRNCALPSPLRLTGLTHGMSSRPSTAEGTPGAQLPHTASLVV